MSDDLKVISVGDTIFLPGEVATRVRFTEENKRVLASGGEPATAKQIILGITKRSISTDSWLSAASFEQTTDVLTEVSLEGKEDKLVGLKENVIIGKKIPVGVEEDILSQEL
jgi:DNA-directed RNA polymerase subunit beta'